MVRRKTKISTGLKSPKAKVNITISPESKSVLEKIVSEIAMTKSSFFEGILNGSICLSSQNAQKLVSFESVNQNGEIQSDNAP